MDLQLIGMEVNSDFLEQYSVLRVSLFCDHVCVYTLCPSKFDTLLSNVITLSNIGRFSNFFQHCNRHEIWNKTAVEISRRP